MMLRAASLLLRLRLRRLLNMLGSRFMRRKSSAGGPRGATAPKQGGATLATILSLVMVGYATFVAWSAVHNVRLQLAVPEDAGELRWERSFRALDAPPGLDIFSPGVTDGFILVLSLIAVASLAMSLGAKELAAAEWDMEWLVTLPIPRRTLLGVRLLERTFINPSAVLFMVPFLAVLAWQRGAGWVAPLIGLALALPLLLLLGALRLAVDTGVRVRLQPGGLRNLQAVLAIVGLAMFYLALSASISPDSFVLRWARSLPAAVHWLPTGLIIDVLAARDARAALLPGGLLLAQVGVVVTLIMLGVEHLLSRGIVAHGGRESARSAPRPVARTGARRWLTAIQAREIKLLLRDRNFLVQTLVLPVVIIGAQFFFNARLLDTLGEEPAHLAAMAFGLAAYVLMFSAFQTLNSEGHALWILYTVPVPLDVLLRQKARLWGLITLIYPLAMFAFFLRGGLTGETASLLAVVLLGVPVYATLAVCIGVLGSDPLSQEVQRRVRGSSAYLFMLLASLYTYAIYSASLWQRLTLMLLCASLAFALWQKVRDRLPYLLDPTAKPPAHVSLADGLVAALLFFVLQGVVMLAVMSTDRVAIGPAIFIAFAVSGAVTYFAMIIAFAKLKSLGVPAYFGPRKARAAGIGLLAGAGAAVCGVGYLAVAQRIPALQELLQQHAVAFVDMAGWITPLAILAAPVFEEFIFRGLIFGGLRRTLGRWPAVLGSAGLFAMCHGPVSFLPVLGLGIAAALAYDATGMLLAPMLAHALYNTVVLCAEWILPAAS